MASSRTKRIAIIGAGASGMTSAKACLEQNLEPVVFEKTNYTGGLWRFQNKVTEDGIASVMQSTIINSSKEMSAFSDFPPPADYPNYMHNTKQVAYFDAYAEKFNFTKYVRFRTEIISVNYADDFKETGRWLIHFKDLNTTQEHREIFDGVMVCTGHHGTMNKPTFKDEHLFKGTIMHTHSLKSASGFENKNVVVVGIGNSGGDAAVELSLVAKQVYLSTRRGTWVQRRVGHEGRPSDMGFHRRFLIFIANLLPYWLLCTIFEWNLNKFFDHEKYGLKPNHRVFSQHVMVNDSLPNRILSGTVAVKGDIAKFTEDGVVFQGDEEVTPVDVVILATGYKVSYPFIPNHILPVDHNKVRLYKYQFIPTLAHPETLAIIGLIQPIGAILPISELQARWFSLLNAGKLKLPPVEQLEEDITKKATANKKRYYDSPRHTIQVDWYLFMEELAGVIGANPPIWRYMFTDPKLFFALIFGPGAAYQYRLVGPNAWSGARDAYLTVEERMLEPLKTSRTKNQKKNNCKCSGNLFWYFSIGSAMLAFYTYFNQNPLTLISKIRSLW